MIATRCHRPHSDATLSPDFGAINGWRLKSSPASTQLATHAGLCHVWCAGTGDPVLWWGSTPGTLLTGFITAPRASPCLTCRCAVAGGRCAVPAVPGAQLPGEDLGPRRGVDHRAGGRRRDHRRRRRPPGLQQRQVRRVPFGPFPQFAPLRRQRWRWLHPSKVPRRDRHMHVSLHVSQWATLRAPLEDPLLAAIVPL